MTEEKLQTDGIEEKPKVSVESPQDPQVEVYQEIEKLKAEKQALQGIVSGKDKAMSEVAKVQQELQTKLARMEEEIQLRDKVMNLDVPKTIKDAIMKDFSLLNAENFDSRVETYTSIYNGAIEEQKSQIHNSIINKPTREIPQDFDEQLNSIDPTDPDAIEKLLELSRKI
jgi:hypothetical protein